MVRRLRRHAGIAKRQLSETVPMLVEPLGHRLLLGAVLTRHIGRRTALMKSVVDIARSEKARRPASRLGSAFANHVYIHPGVERSERHTHDGTKALNSHRTREVSALLDAGDGEISSTL